MRQLFVLALLTICSATFSQKMYWKSAINTGEFGLLAVNFTLEKKGDLYYGTTPINAHKRIVGGIKAAFAKSMFQKDGSIVELDSISIAENNLSGYLLLQKKKYHIEGSLKGDSVQLRIFGKASGKTYGSVQALVVAAVEKPKDYVAVWQRIKLDTEKYIYRKNALSTPAWRNFVEKMDEFSAIAEDDAEFAFGFFQFSKEVGFSHYAVMGSKEHSTQFFTAGYTAPTTQIRPSLTAINATTYLLDIPVFNFRSNEIDSIMQAVISAKPANLIIDLRNNTGGDMEGGMRICQYITNKTLYGGVMLSQFYWNKNDTAPSPSTYKNFKPMNSANYEWFKQQVSTGVEGLCLITEPLPTTYKGNIIILTSKTTASAAEPFVYTLQKENIATVIGENTSGSVLSMEYFFIDNLAYTIPMLDYYTFDGKRLDQVGVQPNIVCEPKQALNIALEKIK